MNSEQHYICVVGLFLISFGLIALLLQLAPDEIRDEQI